MEIIFDVTFLDERLVIMELKNQFRMPMDYFPWLPEIITHPIVPVNITVYLDPLIGMINAIYRFAYNFVYKILMGKIENLENFCND